MRDREPANFFASWAGVIPDRYRSTNSRLRFGLAPLN